MKKLRPTLDDLEVQSFATTAPEPQQRGTVKGHDDPTIGDECPTWYFDEGCDTWGCSNDCTDGPTAACSVDDWCTMYPGNPSGC